VIRLRGICRDYPVGDQVVHALDHVDLDVAEGEYISIMGPSGSGKSTLLNVIGLLDRPNAGVYELTGHNVGELDDDALAELQARRWPGSVSARAAATGLTSSPAASASASRSHALSSCSRKSCWPMNRPAISTRSRAAKSSA
jgi:ABC-type branched-subunit amino acid transport system ATPase component